MSNPPKDERRRNAAEKIQRQLDEALADSFPASDPVSIVTSHEEEDWGVEPDPPEPPGKPAPPRDP
jgi:2-methylcitrate dehydratase PrpD